MLILHCIAGLFDCSGPGNNTPVSFERITHPSFLDWVMSVGWTPCSGFINLADQGTVSIWTCDWFSDGHVTPCGSVGEYSRDFSRTTGGSKNALSAGATSLVEYYLQVWMLRRAS